MDLAALVRAVEVLMSPLEWGSREAWLDESMRRVRDVCGTATKDVPADAVDVLEALLRLPNDKPGWLQAALDSPAAERQGSPLPSIADAPEAILSVVSLRCALVAGLAALNQLHASRSTLGHAFDEVETGMAIFGNGGLREVARNVRLGELLKEEPARGQLLDLMGHQARLAGAPGALGQDCRELELAGGFYRLVASRAAAGTLLPEAAVLILVDRLSPRLPTNRSCGSPLGSAGASPRSRCLRRKDSPTRPSPSGCD